MLPARAGWPDRGDRRPSDDHFRLVRGGLVVLAAQRGNARHGLPDSAAGATICGPTSKQAGGVGARAR